jgi:hypothetical protein
MKETIKGNVTTQVLRLKTEGEHSSYQKCWISTHDGPLQAFGLQSIHLRSYKKTMKRVKGE